jgi:glycosyltransferase involved in cell wall biosynthesis
MPLVSIIIATHNRADKLPPTVHSLLTQTFKDFEILIVDDASKDETQQVIENLKNSDNRILSFRSVTNIGPGAARNLGIENASGSLIAIMDDDDLAKPYRLELEVKAMQEYPDMDLVCSSIEMFDDQHHIINLSPGIIMRGCYPKTPQGVFKLLYLEGKGIPNQTVMMRKSLYERFQYPNKPWGPEDWIFFMQLTASGVRTMAISTPLVMVYKGIEKQSLTADNRTRVFAFYLEAIRIIKHWLTDQGIHEFDSLHQLALSNLYLRESRHYLGIKGIKFILRALWSKPTNPKVWKELFVYWKKITKYIKNSTTIK